MPDRAERQLEEAKQLLDRVNDRSSSLVSALNRYRWFLAVTVVLVVAVGVLGWTTYKTSQCNSTWANDYTNRATTLTDLSSSRTDALDQLLRDAFLPNPDRGKLAADAKNYVTISDAYRQALKDHPIPSAPANNCSVF